MRVRKTISAAVLTAAVLTLSGCAGFLVPAGEGRPAPEPGRTAATRPWHRPGPGRRGHDGRAGPGRPEPLAVGR